MAPLSLTTLPDGIIERICRLLFRPPGSRHPRRQPALAALARTCRHLSEPALELLWHNLASLVPLVVYTLPKDLYTVVSAADTRRVSYVKYRLEFLRDPRPEDFTRFSTYAIRVKKFAYNGGAAPFLRYQIPSDLWVRLLHYGPKPLFPNIKDLRHRETDYEYLRLEEFDRDPVYHAELLLGPALKEVDVDYGGWPSDEQRPNELVRAMSHASPHVEALTLGAGANGQAYCRDMTDTALLSCPETGRLLHLVKFDAYKVQVAPAALAGLASLPSLQELQLYVNPVHYDWDALPHDRRRGPFFPGLTILTLYGIPFEWTVAFIRVVTSSSLWQVAVSHAKGEAASDVLLYALCASLRELPSCRTLQLLSIHTGGPVLAVTPSEVYRPEHIAPLLSLSALRVLSIRGIGQVIIDDYLLHHISWAWPSLETLKLSFKRRTGPGFQNLMQQPGDFDHPRATLDGLILLARYCPYLTTLELAVDMRWIPDFDAWPSPPISLRAEHAPPLATFDPSGSVFQEGDALPLAAFFSLIFPRMAELRGPFGTLMWPAVGDHYWRFVRLRSQERGLLRRPTRPREHEPYIPRAADSDDGYRSDSSAESLPAP